MMHGTPAFICGGAGVDDFGFAALNLPIRCGNRTRRRAVTLADVIWRRKFSLLFVCVLMAACGAQAPQKPDLPESVSPGWKLSSLDKSGLPAGVSSDGSPQCWKAVYSGSGNVESWVCWYKVAGSAFDAVQRVPAEAQTVKFQKDQWFVLLKWNNVSRADLTALIRAVQKAL